MADLLEQSQLTCAMAVADVHMMCTPTRSSFQSGRLPIHVLTQLSSPCDHNGAIPRNMTGVAAQMKKAGCEYTGVFWSRDGSCQLNFGPILLSPAHRQHAPGWQVGLRHGHPAPHSARAGLRYQLELFRSCVSHVVQFTDTSHRPSIPPLRPPVPHCLQQRTDELDS